MATIFFFLTEGNEKLSPGIYRLNEDGSCDHYVDIAAIFHAALALIEPISQKIADLDASRGVSQGELTQAKEELTQLKGELTQLKDELAQALDNLKKFQTIESANAPNFDDPNWSTWIQYLYDYSVPSGVAKAWIRTPGNDALSFPNTWNLPVKIPTVADATQDPNRADMQGVALPQGVSFRFQPIQSDRSLSCDISYPADTFSGISYQLMDANKAVIPKTPRGQQVSATDVAAGLGWANVPSNARFALFTFSYKNGGNVPFEIPLT